MYLEAKALEDLREIEREDDFCDWGSFKRLFGLKCGRSAVRYQDIVKELMGYAEWRDNIKLLCSHS